MVFVGLSNVDGVLYTCLVSTDSNFYLIHVSSCLLSLNRYATASTPKSILCLIQVIVMVHGHLQKVARFSTK
jgi:hypothetical protein